MLPETMNMNRRLLPENGNKTQDSYINDANFDTNLLMILAALLCALFFALGLNSIASCALRCRRRFGSETPEQAAATGLKERELKQIPVAVYGSGEDFRSNDCPICLGEFVDGDKVRVLPKCKHGFHVMCIDKWLLSHSSCPNCRYSLLEQDIKAKTTRTSPEVTGRRPSGNELANYQSGSVVVLVDEGS